MAEAGFTGHCVYCDVAAAVALYIQSFPISVQTSVSFVCNVLHWKPWPWSQRTMGQMSSCHASNKSKEERSTSVLLWERRGFPSCCCQHWLLSLWVVIKGSQIILEPLVMIGGRAGIGRKCIGCVVLWLLAPEEVSKATY